MDREKLIENISTKRKTILAYTIRLILVLFIFIEIRNGRLPILLINLLALIISFLPLIVDRIFSFSLFTDFELPFLTYLLLSVFLEKILSGSIFQIYLGMSLGFIGFILMFILYSNSRIKMGYSLVALFSFCFSVALGAVWEVFRYSLTLIFNLKLGDFNINYTALGLTFTMIGAIIASISGYLYLKYGKGSLFRKIASTFVIKNPKLLIGYENSPDYIQDLIRKGESETLEFKSTLRTNLHTKNTDKKIEHSVMKTITAFLNSDGGTLLVGVSDDGAVMGIEKDGFQNVDVFYRHFSNLIKKHIGNEYLPFIKSNIVAVNETSVLKVDCSKSYNEVFLKSENDEEFYVRTGPSSIKLNGSKLVSYIDQRFKKD